METKLEYAVIQPVPEGACKPETSAASKLDSDTDTPIYTAAPRYPDKAAREGVQGCVLLNFDLLTDGSTSNIKIEKAYPEGVFNKVARDAIAQWKYPTTTPGTSRNKVVTLSFRLEEES